MRKYVAPEVFSYCDNETNIETTDKEFAVIMYEYAKKKTGEDLTLAIKKLKESIKEENEK